MKQLTKEQAIEFHDNAAWEEMTFQQRAEFQMQQDCLCMPFAVFHKAIEKALGRPVFTHEFGLNKEGLMKELFEDTAASSLAEVMELIPEEKRIVI